jgi:YfiH family protein
MTSFIAEESAVGRVVVPSDLPAGLALFYTTADFEGRLDKEAAARLMGVVRERFAIEAAFSTCSQVHGKNVVEAAPAPRWRECDSCDALWSAEKGSALGIKVADCLPVTVADMKHGVIANIHSGWRGAAQKITAETLDVIAAKTNFDPAEAEVWLGPSIRVCCFEVGEEVVDAFRDSYDEAERFVDRGGIKPHIDLPALTTSLLIGRGITADRIHDSGLCTRCPGSIFHSYRRDPKRGGRNLAIVAH